MICHILQFPITALREVKMLQKLKHKHITELIEICSSRGMSFKIFSFLKILVSCACHLTHFSIST